MLLKNERGSSLVMVLLVLTVGSIIGLAMLTIGVNEDLQVSAEEKNIQAYYIARSAVDAVGAHIINEKLKDAEDGSYTFDVSDFVDLVNDHGEPIEFADGEAGVILRSIGDTIEIEATSTYADDFTGHATLVLDERLYFESLIWSEADVDKSDINISADPIGSDLEISSNGEFKQPDKVESNPADSHALIPNQDLKYPEPDIPEGLPNVGDVNWNTPDNTYVDGDLYDSGKAGHHLINSSTEYGKFRFSSGVLFIDTTAGSIDIVVEEGEIKSDVVILGDNKVNFYVDNKELNISTPISVNDSPEKLTIYLAAGSELTMTGNADLYGYIKGPSATVTMSSSDIEFYGAIVCGSFEGSGNANLEFVPESAANDDEHLMERSIWKD